MNDRIKFKVLSLATEVPPDSVLSLLLSLTFHVFWDISFFFHLFLFFYKYSDDTQVYKFSLVSIIGQLFLIFIYIRIIKIWSATNKLKTYDDNTGTTPICQQGKK